MVIRLQVIRPATKEVETIAEGERSQVTSKVIIDENLDKNDRVVEVVEGRNNTFPQIGDMHHSSSAKSYSPKEEKL